MADGNTQFRVENGLFVLGLSTLTGDATAQSNVGIIGTLSTNSFAAALVSTFSGNVKVANTTANIFFVDVTNSRLGVGTDPLTPDLMSINGNVAFQSINNSLRFRTANASMNASISYTGDASNTRLTFATVDGSNSTSLTGGFRFISVANGTSNTTMLEFSNAVFQYKSGNVAHAGNFGVYNVSGTRVGP